MNTTGKKFGGRTKGTPNKESKKAEDIAIRLGCDPFEILIFFAQGDWKALGYKSGVIMKRVGKELYEEDRISPDLRASAAGKACEYIYPKLKTLEHKADESLLSDITRTILHKKVG